MRTKKNYDMILTAIFAGLLAVCSWISIPTVIPFTMQTFGLFLTLYVLGGKRGTAAVLVYILLGITGLPVFSGFTAGIGVLAGTTGGYIIGFLFSGLVYWWMEYRFLKYGKKWITILAMALGMFVYYIFGTVWFMTVYAETTGPVGLLSVLNWCVFPFVLPDVIKLSMAVLLGDRIKRSVSVQR